MRVILLATCFAATTGFAAAPNRVIASMERSVSPQVVIRGEHRAAVSLAERMAQLQVNAVSIAVVRDLEIDWTRAYGYADRERKIAATPDTLFQAGSISKPIAALAVLRRVDADALDLDHDVNDYLRSWHVPDSELTAVHKVTIRNILDHTAGLTVWGFPGYPPGADALSTVDILNGKGNSPPVRVWKQPDLSWRYSGGGYTILQLLLSERGGMSFPALMRDTVLKPLQMNRSTFEQPLPEMLRAMAASGYDGSGKKVEGGWRVHPEMAAAGLWTTPSDLARYVITVQKAQRGDTRILSPQLTRAMLTPTPRVDTYGHALGPVVTEDRLRFGHSGATEGFQADMTGFLDGRGGAIVMTNSGNGIRLAREIILTLGSLYGWAGMKPVEQTVAAVSTATLDSFCGSYALPSGEDGGATEVLDVTREAGTLVVTSEGQRAMTLLPASDHQFFDRDSGRKVEFPLAGTTVTMDIGRGQRAVRRNHD